MSTQPETVDPAKTVGFGLPRANRLRLPHEFRRVYARGIRTKGPRIVVIAFARRDPGHRLGLAVSKQHGCAVRRNKIKRILREAFRLERPTLPGRFDLILIPQPRGRDKLVLDEVRVELRKLVGDAQHGKGHRRRPPGRRSKGNSGQTNRGSRKSGGPSA